VPKLPNPLGLPNPMKLLWKAQYAPREKYIKKNLTKAALKKWNKQTLIKKMMTIDRLQAKDFFENVFG
jgi:hypothetical protein